MHQKKPIYCLLNALKLTYSPVKIIQIMKVILFNPRFRRDEARLPIANFWSHPC